MRCFSFSRFTIFLFFSDIFAGFVRNYDISTYTSAPKVKGRSDIVIHETVNGSSLPAGGHPLGHSTRHNSDQSAIYVDTVEVVLQPALYGPRLSYNSFNCIFVRVHRCCLLCEHCSLEKLFGPLTYVDATIRVVLQSGEEKKWERRKPFKVGFLEVTESDAPGTHYQRNAKKQDRPPFRPGLHMLSGF